MPTTVDAFALSPAPAVHTLGELKAAGYRYRSVKAELRENALALLAARAAPSNDAPPDRTAPLLPGILGYQDSVEPELLHAVLSQHDLLLLGLRGQAKTRILRALVHLLDEWIPVIDDANVTLREDPLHPTTSAGRAAVTRRGDATPVRWVHRADRYTEKLATPDVTIADLIGELDIVKYAAGSALDDQATMHFGLIPRANRGLFALNELPDLAPRIQVGLFNVLEERDVQIRGFAVRLDLDLSICFSANPEDYTNRGRIVTPLKDRIGSVIRTHYPAGHALAMRITRENAFVDRSAAAATANPPLAAPSTSLISAADRVAKPANLRPVPATPTVIVPPVMHRIVEELISQARRSTHVNQASGVSVRASIAALENVVSSAERRALTTGEPAVAVRPCDLAALLPGVRSKIELLMADDAPASGRSIEDRLIDSLLGEAVKAVIADVIDVDQVTHVTEAFKSGLRLQLTELTPAADVAALAARVKGLPDAAGDLAKELDLNMSDPQQRACAIELVLEFLYVNSRLSRSGRAYAR